MSASGSSDPLRAMRRRTRLLSLIVAPLGVLVGILVGVWALWPLEPVEVHTPEIAVEAAERPASEVEPLDMAGFDAQLWHEPPEEQTQNAAAEKPEPQVPLPEMELIAILRGGGAERRAAIYLAQADELRIVGIGDELVAGSRIADVDDGGVLIEHRGRTRRIELPAAPEITIGSMEDKAGETIASSGRRPERRP